MTDTGIQAYASLGDDINKKKDSVTQETKQGVVSDKLPELELDMSEEDILKLTRKWQKSWDDSPKKAEWIKQGEENEKYWLGQQFDTPKADKNRPMIDNLIFEALETYLPQATRRNPEPLATLDASETSDETKEKYVQKVKDRLGDIGGKNKIRLKLKKGARHWAIFLLGVAKFGWDLDRDIPVVRIIRPKKIILDPDATIDEDGYNGGRVGEIRKLAASKILAIIGEKEDEVDSESGDTLKRGNGEAVQAIKNLVKDDLATEVQFIEWWTNEYMCWTLSDKTVLLKKKNPHWNYDSTELTTQVDEFGSETPSENVIGGINHLPSPRMPFSFLTVFNLGDQPMDKTSLISQNLSNQDRVNKRDKQIDKNVDRQNGGMVVSLARSGLTQSQAKNVTETLRKGGVVAIPDGIPREAIDTYQPPALPADVFNDRNDTRIRLRAIFGVEGSSPSGISAEQTVRGKIISRALDTDRIGGGVTEYLEQWAGDMYNWLLQLLYVYDPAFQFVPGAVPPKVIVSVKEGSLLPKDSTSIANQALELAGMNRIANIDLYKRLEYPNPEELAANVWLETNAPEMLFKENALVQEAIAMKQAAAVAAAEQESIKTQQNAENNMAMSRMKHEDDMEKEQLRGELKGDGNRSILSQVQQDGTMQSGP